MKTSFSIRKVALWATLAVGGAALAAGAGSPPHSGPNAPSREGMMGQGMMDMMRSCQSMMGSGSSTGAMGMPKLPPGNEKLEAQMHAEMMQKMGEIAGRYADRLKDSR